MTRRVLMIAYLFPPIANSGTQRPVKFAKYLTPCGWDPIVLTADRPPNDQIDTRLLHEVPADIRVVRVPMLNERVGDLLGSLALGASARSRISTSVSWRLRERWHSPDLYALWRPTARRAALRVFRETGFDAVYATGFPWTSLLIGRDVSRATGCPLVADFRDPWVADELFNSGVPAHADDRSLERTVVEHASAVISVSDSMTATMAATHPDACRSKFVTIPNGYDPDDLVAAPAARGDRFRIVYAGVWKPGYGPDALYEVIARLAQSAPQLVADVEVMAAGFPPGAAAARGISRYITELGVISHQSAVSLMRSADILYLPNGDASQQQWNIHIPGKAFEYLATGRPVLALTEPDGELGRLIQQVGGGVTVSPGDPGHLDRVVTDALLGRSLAVPPRKLAALEAFERPALARRLADVLDSATQSSVTEGFVMHK
jgi:glycosyltransferase involved in cell wall biosynthesis